MENDKIIIRGARENNLKNINIEIPHFAITAIVGISGSGKSSLAFDIIARESQRIYAENFHAGKTFQKMPARPDCDEISNLFPVVVVEQDESVRSARSTVGTFSELYDFIRLIFARYAVSPGKSQASKSQFSFNRPEGWCPRCQGLGVEDHIVASKIIDNPKKSLREKALKISTPNGYIMYSQVTLDELDKVCKAHDFSIDTPWENLSEEQQNIIWYGSEKVSVLYGKHPLENRLKWAGITAKPREEGYYKGVITIMDDILRRDRNPGILRFAETIPCNLCKGERLSEESLSYTWHEKNIARFHRMSINELQAFFSQPSVRESLAPEITDEFLKRCRSVIALGLGHLLLNRHSGTLSGPETGRLKLSSQVNSGLSHLVYILDEPGTGLHHSETDTFAEILRTLCNQKNTVIIVSHDENIIRHCDYIVELGPRAGSNGGEIIFSGTAPDYFARPNSFNQESSSGEISKPAGSTSLRDIRYRTLQLPVFDIQHQTLNVVSGPSGSGKSALLEYIANHKTIMYDVFDKIVYIDASPIGRMPSSNIATYTGLSDHIRDLMAKTHEAQALKVGKSAFSFNVSGGRCEECSGAGVVSTGMHFMGIVHIPCESCGGKRFRPFVLDIRYRGLNIHEILNLRIEEAIPFFEGEEKITRYLQVLSQLGLGYLTLGQPSPTLSGGEAQRVKLASELVLKTKGSTLYLMDEPSAGLHPWDIGFLIQAIDVLCQKGHTVLVAENSKLLIGKAGIHTELNSVFPKDILSAEQTSLNLRDEIVFENIRTHHLNIPEIRIPYGKIICLGGPSGAGKSSLAIDTIYTEARKRLIENLSAYYRQMSGTPGNPLFGNAQGLTPVVALEKKSSGHNPRSLVATYSGIYDMLRLIYSRFGDYPEGVEPLLSSAFSFNHENGACTECKGLGFRLECDEDLFVINPRLSIFNGAWGGSQVADFYADPYGQYLAILGEIEKAGMYNFHEPWANLDHETRQVILRGTGKTEYQVNWDYKRGKTSGTHRFHTKWKGLFNIIEEEYLLKQYSRRGEQIKELLSEKACPCCLGQRLRPETLAVTLNGKNIAEAISLTAGELRDFLKGSPVFPEWKERIVIRLNAIEKVGISYLNMNRTTATLSGGEFQRLRMAGLLHTPLTGMLYILDEPGFGLGKHERKRLLEIIRGFKSQGNTVLMIENLPEMMAVADEILMLGPGAGKQGGLLNTRSTLAEISGQYDACCHKIQPEKLPDLGITELKNIHIRNIRLPLLQIRHGQLNVITGPSGSGKSTLLREVIFSTVSRKKNIFCDSFALLKEYTVLYSGQENPEGHGKHDIAAFAGFDGMISGLFASQAKKQGLEINEKHFSQGKKEGKCKSCGGTGTVKIALDFWGDDISICENCKGQRFENEVLKVRLDEYNINEILDAALSEIETFLRKHSLVKAGSEADRFFSYCQLLGLMHLPAGQACSTLSGGEYQRLRLARNAATLKQEALLLLDEPSGGLAPGDTVKLIAFLKNMIKEGHTIVCATHDELIVKAANVLIEL